MFVLFGVIDFALEKREKQFKKKKATTIEIIVLNTFIYL